MAVNDEVRNDPHVKSPLPAQAGGAPVTPSALESALAKLRECADKTMFAEVTHEEAAALLAKIEAADRLAEFLVNLRAASRGVAGYHLNGNIAEWDEFEEMNLLAAYRNPAPAAEGEHADWCPVCGGKDGQHLRGCEDGSEVL